MKKQTELFLIGGGVFLIGVLVFPFLVLTTLRVWGCL